MADIVNIGATANDGSGDDLRTSFQLINQRFQDLLGTLSQITWAPGLAITATPLRQWAVVSGQAYVAASNHIAGATFAADLAGGLWLAVDVAQLISDLGTAASGKGAEMVAFDGGTVQDVLDDAKPMQSYTALRAYTGRATSVRITTPGISGFFARDGSDTTSADNGGTVIVDASGRRWKRLFTGPVDVKWFGAKGDGVADDTPPIQAAIDYAESLVSVAVDGVGDRVNGCTVVMRGVFKITEPLRIAADNVCLEGQGGATIYPYFTSMAGYNGAKPAIIVGTAEQWQLAGLISGTCKYNRITGINIKRVAGYNDFIGVLVSGTRNAIVSDCLFERGFCGLYLENTSEFYSEQVSVIGCTYGGVCDNRGQRIAANSVLNVANDDNDVSSNKFDQLTVYYAQHTGFLAINTGTTVVDGMTMGLFSDNPSAGSPALGLPAAYAGFHVLGGANTKWTRGLLVDNAVFEAKDNASRDCIRLESSTANNPILGCTFNNVHVQTFAADYTSGNVTTFIKAAQSGPGKIANIVVRDSGFTFQSAGYYYGRMCDISGLAVVAFDNCYPNVAFSTSSVGYYGSLRNVNYLDRVNINAFPPSGWATEGVTAGCSKQGGSNGEISFLRFTGDAGQILMYRDYIYREYTPELGSAFVSFLARGDAGLLCSVRVNGEASTDSSIKSPENEARYSNAYIEPSLIDATTWKRIVFAFNPFAANFEFDRALFVLGKKPSATSAEKVEIADIKVGYFVGGLVPYNPF